MPFLSATSLWAPVLAAATRNHEDDQHTYTVPGHESTIDYIFVSLEVMVREKPAGGVCTEFDVYTRGKDRLPTAIKATVPGSARIGAEKRCKVGYDRAAASNPKSPGQQLFDDMLNHTPLLQACVDSSSQQWIMDNWITHLVFIRY